MLASIAVKLYLAAYSFHIVPDPNAPGLKGIQKGTNELAMYALIACGIGAVASLILIAAAKGVHLERLHTRGKEGFVVAIIGAFVVGIVSALLNAAYSA